MRLVNVNSGNNSALPHRIQQIILCHYSLAVLNKEDEQIKHLRLDIYLLGAAAELAPLHVERIAGKAKLHLLLPQRGKLLHG